MCQLTQKGAFYVTKMKKNQRYKLENSVIQVNKEGLAILNDGVVLFEKDEIRHTSRKIECWENGKMHSNVLLTNNFELESHKKLSLSTSVAGR